MAILEMKAFVLFITLATLASAYASEVRVYREADLPACVDQKITTGACLVGQFIYLGNAPHGFDAFSSFNQSSGEIKFGNILIVIRFPNGVPYNLSVGKVIAPDEKNPLSLEAVTRSSDGALILVRATYQEKE